MRTRLVIMLGSILVGLGPSAAADFDDGLFAFEIDGDELYLRMQYTGTGEEAQEVREEIDEEAGNGDGMVSMEEISRYNAANLFKFSRDDPSCFEDWELVLIDTHTPKRLTQMSASVEQAIGSITSTAPVKLTVVFAFLFPSGTSSLHRVQVEYDELDSFGESVGCWFDTWFDEETFAGMESGPYDMEMPDSEWPSDMTLQNQYQTYQGGTSSFVMVPEGPETTLFSPRPGHSIREDSIKPERARALWDGKSIRADTGAEQLVLMDEVVTFDIAAGDTNHGLEGTVKDVGMFVGFGVMGGGFLLLAAGISTEYGRFHLLKLLFLIPGFSRLEKDEVLEHSKRDELYRFIKQSPGPSFSDLRRELGLSNGTLVHHLRILEAQEYVKGVRDGFRTRFYVRGPKIVMDSYLTRTQIQLVDAISANPGLTQKELSQMLGLPRESISYHAKQLAAKGRLAIQQKGKWRHYFPAPSTQPSVTSAPVQS